MATASLCLPQLGGCTAQFAGLGAGLLPALAFLAAVALAFALGGALARLRTERALRRVRAELRQQTCLHEGVAWQTDAAHQLVAWGAATGAATGVAAALFAAAKVNETLAAQRAFTELHVHLCAPLPGPGPAGRAWVLRAVPRYDDLGLFEGYAGMARPVDDRSAALAPLLALHAGPALLAVDHGSGWRLEHCNAAASVLWPALQPGAELPAALGTLPDAVSAAFLAAGPASAELAVDGWRLLPCDEPGSGARALLLAQQVHAAAEGGAQAAAESDNFSFTVSHDLRAPIRVVEGFTRIVKEDYGRLLDRVGNDHLDRVLGAAARMNLMIDALLTLARLSSQPLARQPVNLSQLAGYVIDDLRRGAPEREAEIEIEPGLSTEGDPTLLRLVLENLLGNAWKYSARCPKARIALQTVAHAGRQAYVVRDNGAGFDMRSADRLFGLFQRLHSASEFAGHGVGLASVRRIVRRHGGDIWAEAEPGRGAAFYFTLA